MRAKEKFAHGGIALEDAAGRQTIFSSTVDVFASNGVMHVLLDVMRAPELDRMCVQPPPSLMLLLSLLSSDLSRRECGFSSLKATHAQVFASSDALTPCSHPKSIAFCPLKDRASGVEVTHKVTALATLLPPTSE